MITWEGSTNVKHPGGPLTGSGRIYLLVYTSFGCLRLVAGVRLRTRFFIYEVSMFFLNEKLTGKQPFELRDNCFCQQVT